MEKYENSYRNNISSNVEWKHDGPYSVSDISDYFEYIINKHQTVNDNPLIRIFINKIENSFTSKIKTGYYLKLLTPETMKLLWSTKSKITKNENG